LPLLTFGDVFNGEQNQFGMAVGFSDAAGVEQ
jgi:hypothetical protein